MTTDASPGIAVKSRDDTEFEALFLAHYNGVYRLLFRIVGSHQEAEDLAQEVFLRLYRQQFPEGREHNVRAWLYRVATNLAYNTLRGQRRQERNQAIAEQQMTAVGEALPDPVQSVIRADERERVHQVLAGLPPRQAQLLLLRHAGLSYQELADVLGIAPGSVGTLLARATAAFEQAYRAEVAGLEQGMGDVGG